MALGKLSALRSKLAGGGVELKSAVVSGAAADTNIAVSGLSLQAQILAVVMFDTGVPSDVGSEVSISAAGQIQLSTTDSTGNKLLVIYAQPS